MAEGFANRHGAGILVAESAGLSPAGIIVEQTVHAMAEKSIDISSYFSKALRLDQANEHDLIVNMSGFRLPDGIRAPAVEWDVPDPIGESDEVYAQVRDQIEGLVIELVGDLRRARDGA
jgi:arsenate reductase